MNLYRQKLFIATIFFCGGAFAGALLVTYLYPPASTSEDSVSRQGGYAFINPLLSCDISENKQFENYQPITKKLEKYIREHTSNDGVQSISVYFRGLDTGHWSGVNENTKYSPASLLKVPLMIAYLKEADIKQGILEQKITYHQDADGNMVETFKPKYFIKDGETYTVAELLRYMIAYSDNNAAALLQNNVDHNSLIEVYSDLGIPVSDTLAEETITPKIYSYIFRVLYNATYLSRPMSQYALQLLSTTEFSQGIKAGVPATTPSAQKFGERTVLTENSATKNTTPSFKELHDCGIVYYPRNPYLICVMTKGNDFSKLSSVIGDISALVYQETESGVLKN